jgi:hypothetical protein
VRCVPVLRAHDEQQSTSGLHVSILPSEERIDATKRRATSRPVQRA